jgi:uncharacterized membrane protein YczE
VTHSKRTAYTIAAVILSGFILEFSLQFINHPAALIGSEAVYGVAIILLTCWWVSFDSVGRNVRPPYAHIVLLLATGLPTYFFRSRGFWRGLLASTYAAGILIVPFVLGAYAGWYAAH